MRIKRKNNQIMWIMYVIIFFLLNVLILNSYINRSYNEELKQKIITLTNYDYRALIELHKISESHAHLRSTLYETVANKNFTPDNASVFNQNSTKAINSARSFIQLEEEIGFEKVATYPIMQGSKDHIEVIEKILNFYKPMPLPQGQTPAQTHTPSLEMMTPTDKAGGVPEQELNSQNPATLIALEEKLYLELITKVDEYTEALNYKIFNKINIHNSINSHISIILILCFLIALIVAGVFIRLSQREVKKSLIDNIQMTLKETLTHQKNCLNTLNLCKDVTQMSTFELQTILTSLPTQNDNQDIKKRLMRIYRYLMLVTQAFDKRTKVHESALEQTQHSLDEDKKWG